MDPLPTAQRWLAGLLGIAYLLDLTVMDFTYALVPLPLMGCVFLALRRPLIGALTGAFVLLVMSVAVRSTGYSLGQVAPIHTLTVAEAVAGGALVMILVWRAAASTATGGTVVLIAATWGAIILRSGWSPYDWGYVRLGSSDIVDTGIMGVIILVVAVGAGRYLRRTMTDQVTDEQRLFLRKQWPLAAALTMLFLLDLLYFLFGMDLSPLGLLLALVVLAAAAVSAGCAFLGPRAPVRYAMIAAVATTMSVIVVVATNAHAAGSLRFAVPLTAVGAHMALVSYVVRYAERTQALLCVGILAGSDLLAGGALLMKSGRDLSDLREAALLGGFLLLLAAATGQYFRSRDRDRKTTVEVAVTSAQQAERMALARELHDVVAHHVTGIVVQAQAARLVAAEHPTVAVEALGRIETAGTDALTAMRRLVSSMRGAAPAGSTEATEQATTDLAADLRGVADKFSGPRVTMALDLPEHLPPEMGRSVLRIVQESLTNVSKHAPAARSVSVTISQSEDELHVRVTDDATSRAATPNGGSGGYGLVGMRERVELLGGRLSAGPGEGAGWAVHAVLPLRKENG